MKRTILLTIICLVTGIFAAWGEPTPSVRIFTVRDGLPANAITSVRQAPQGLIWIATWNGLCCYDGYRFTTFKGEPWGSENALSTFRIAAIEPDTQGNVWVMTYDRNLYLFDTRRCQFVNVGQMVRSRYGDDFSPRNIYPLSNGHTWITDEHEGVNLRIDDRCPTDVNCMEVWGSKGKPINGTFIRKAELDAHGHEWIITDLGMQRYGVKEFRKDVFSCHDQGETPESGNLARSYVKEHGIGKHCIDRQGNLWYTSPHGLMLVTFHDSPMRMVPLEGTQETRSLLCRRNGSVWVGTKSGVLAQFDASGTPVGQRTLVPGLYAMMEDCQGNVWIGSKGDGIYVVDGNGKTVAHYTHNDNDRYSLSSNDIYDIDQDEQGNIWIATWGGGVNRADFVNNDKGVRFLHKGNELTFYPKEGFERVRRITHDGHGSVIASTTSGLMTFSSTERRNDVLRFYTTCHHLTDTTSLWTSDVMQTLVTRSGDIYVVTMGGGIQQLVSDKLLQADLKLRIVSKMNQGAGNALSMTEDRQGCIWITRESEVNRYNPKTGQLERFETNSMEETVELTECKTVITTDGRLWAGAVDGVLTFQERQMHKSQYQPAIVFTSIQYQGEQVEQPLLNRQMLDIMNREQRNMTIRFAALDYGDNYLTQYAYQLVGNDDDSKVDEDGWNHIGSTPRLTFSQLSPGWHKLIVKSTNADGVWMDNATELTIYVQPMLLERLWFRLLLIFLAIGLSSVAVIRYLQHRQHNQEREQRLENIMRQYRELQDEMDNRPQSAIETGHAPIREYSLSEPEIADPDEEMMSRLMAYIEQRIGDEALRIEDMADAVGMGRTVFYGKIRELVGLSPSDFLRQIRMQRAEQLISKSKLTFSEIAYSVGFTDPKYFTKCFKKQTGMTPSEYRAKHEESAVG